MVALSALLLPILIAAVAVFFLSFLFHMVLRYHTTDFVKLSNEDAVMSSLRSFKIPPGDYMMPCGTGPESMKDPAFLEKFKQGPVVVMTVMPAGNMSMGKQLVQWFIYCLVVSLIAGYIAAAALPAGSPYLAVFRFAGCTAFLCYAMAQFQDSIWYKRKWTTTMKNVFDGLIYGLFTGGIFGAMWPKG
ncbi:MAG TPA: hypothetical protein VN852_12260 [Candidatus Krumholzibacteria bacterium]|jgi:hypothetical protein|nr:hypothetical protein [Candidatus Krumholzibacteria bacterium]